MKKSDQNPPNDLRPGAETQFKPGKSGNPKGRPKGSRSLAGMANDALKTEMPVTIGGKTEKMPLLQAVLRKCIQQGTAKDLEFVGSVIKRQLAVSASAKQERPDGAKGCLMIDPAPTTLDEWEARFSYLAGAPGCNGKTRAQYLKEQYDQFGSRLDLYQPDPNEEAP